MKSVLFLLSSLVPLYVGAMDHFGGKVPGKVIPPSMVYNELAAGDLATFLERQQICNTDVGTPRESSIKYRKLCFEALKNVGYAHPALIMIASERHAPEACAGPMKDVYCWRTGRGVNMYEPYWERQSYGVLRFVMHHEASHLFFKHYYDHQHGARRGTPDYFVKIQRMERAADKHAAKTCGCELCMRDRVEYQFDCMRTDYFQRGYLIREVDSLEKLDQRFFENASESDELDLMISNLERAVSYLETTHPLHMERILRSYRYSRHKDFGKDKRCAYHKKMECEKGPFTEDELAKMTYKRMGIPCRKIIGKSWFREFSLDEQKRIAREHMWSFDANNSFKRSDVVLVERSGKGGAGGRLAYGIVIGQKEDATVIVQVEIGAQKEFPAVLVGRR